jgi:fatty acid desaturase
MRIWKNTRWDGLLVAYSLAQFGLTIWLATWWAETSLLGRVGGFVLLTLMMAYNIIVVSHLFTHVPWFTAGSLNAAVSVLNSINIGQSVQAYELSHVREHHRFNNDPKGPDGTTRDHTSTYKAGEKGEHGPLLPYALGGAWESFADRGRELLAVTRLWRVGRSEVRLLALATRREPRRSWELRQVRADRAAHCLALTGFLVISWQWTLVCYLPAFFVALAMVNVQNYYRHYGANPDDRAADAVSHYGRLYNRVAFNDGYHQEHHLSPSAHWSQLPGVRERYRDRLDTQPRIVSPVPAVVGFLDRGRPLLHHAAGRGGRV